VAEAPISIVLIHWKIKKDLAPEFEQKWKTMFTINNREGLIGEFLSTVERKGGAHPYITWPIACEDPSLEESCVHYINVALWTSHQRFFEEVGHLMNDDQPIRDFEIERRRRVTVAPTEWRVSSACLPAEDSEGTQ
jgi:hypothetical protein